MLAALILLGILPFAVMPLGGEDSADDGDLSDDGEETGGPVMPIGELDPDPAAGEVFTVSSEPGVTTLDEFEPGTDLVEVDLTAIDGEIAFDAAITEDGASVSFSVGPESTTTIVFSGLSEVPAGDIILRVIDEDSGEPYDVSLGDLAAFAAQLTGLDPVLEPTDPETPGGGTATDPADPETPDPGTGTIVDPVDPELPDPPGPVPDPGTVIDPTDPELPDPPGPVVDPGTVLEPVDPNAEVLGPAGGLALHELLERDSENTVGEGAALSAVAGAGSDDTLLGDGDDMFALPDDGVAGTGSGAVSLDETVPVITSDGPVQVVDGGAGDDQITTGDDAAFAFGGEGDDTLSAGEGAAALYGGAGSDVLTASATGAYLDGGSGDDALTGGAGDDTLEGGEHGAGLSGGDDTIDGGAGDDLIRGGYGADVLSGGAGDDVIDHLGRTEEREVLEQHEFAWHIDGEADSLSGGDGDDTLIFDREDVATGGAGNDLFWLYQDGADSGGVAEVTDFVVGEDFLRVSLNPNIGENGEPDVLVQPSADGSDAVVIVNGDVVAILRGAPDATVSDIYAEVRADIFA